MEIITSLEQLHSYDAPCVVALGTFDGLHRGHLDVIRSAREEARRTGARLAVFTFSNHPFACFRPDRVPPALITSEEKHALLRELGVELLLDVPFDFSIARLEPDEFLRRLQALRYSCLVVGSNFTYGIRGEGDVRTLAAAAERYGFRLIVRTLVSDADTVISSTVIRALIADGSVREAAQMLGRRYSLGGVVAHGNERGRLLAFPTANLELTDCAQVIPKGGVYAVRATVAGREYGGMANIGMNPTFGDVALPRLETHLFDFSDDIYGERLRVEFVERVRGERKFAGIDALKAQLAADREECRTLLAKY